MDWKTRNIMFEELRLSYIREDIAHYLDEADSRDITDELTDEQLAELSNQVLKELDFNDDYADIYWSIVRTCTRSYLREHRKKETT